MTQSPEQRAQKAAEELASAGETVTARAVQKTAGVRMAIASAVATAWNQTSATEQAKTIPMPDTVQARAQGLWETAIAEARTEFEAERDGWKTRITTVETESAGLLEAVTEMEDALQTALTKIRTLEQEALQAQNEHAKTEALLREEKIRAEATLSAIISERDRLLNERDTIQTKADALQADLNKALTDSTKAKPTTPKKPR